MQVSTHNQDTPAANKQHKIEDQLPEYFNHLYISHSFFLRTKNTIFSPPEQGYTICYFCSIFYFLESGRVRSVKLGIGIYF